MSLQYNPQHLTVAHSKLRFGQEAMLCHENITVKCAKEACDCLTFEDKILFDGKPFDGKVIYTGAIENKWFEFGKDEEGNDLPKTVISREYSSEWEPGVEPYYPINDEKNGALYHEYKKLADAEEKVVFGGRLGEYKYYDMDAVIASALEMCEREL